MVEMLVLLPRLWLDTFSCFFFAICRHSIACSKTIWNWNGNCNATNPAWHCYPCIVGGDGCGGGKKLLVILLITCKYIRSATGCSSQYQAIKFFIQNTLNITISHGNESRLGEQQPSRKKQRARNLMKKKKNAQKKQILYVHKVLSSAPCILFAICLNISLTFYWSHFYHFFTAIRIGKNEFLVKFKAMVGMFL